MKKVVSFLLGLTMVAGSAMVGCNRDNIPAEEITVYMPDGAPALALAGLMHEDKADDGVTYRVVDALQIAATTTNKDKEKNADLCVMPVNAAAKLHGESGAYTMLGAVNSDIAMFSEKGKGVLLIAAGLAVGVIAVTAISRPINAKLGEIVAKGVVHAKKDK